ncbi:MAG: type II toxin-antitoxin system VapC family toxin [Candidatus Rokubacteria bacterium]|nr:type II toxin-antitoxin system VapC family toxin [Candidatus Rokubacteria bacterium]
MTRVIDASVALKWVLPLEHLSNVARRLLDDDDEMIAPDIILIEAANALWRKVIRRDLTAPEADVALGGIAARRLHLRSSASVVHRALGLAAALSHPVYDCVYLALAELAGAPLITADDRLAALGARSGTPVRVVALSSL